MSQSPSPFMFQTEFTPHGEVIGGPQTRFLLRDEAEKLAAKARVEGETKARQSGIGSVDRIVAHLSPVAVKLADVAETLRREAAEMAMIAARKIAGTALDAKGEEAAATAIAEVVRMLKLNPVITVSLAPESIPEVEQRMEQLRRQGTGTNIAFVGDPKARPGDWRVDWMDGSTGFSREQVEASIEAIISARLEDPIEPQLELFSAA